MIYGINHLDFDPRKHNLISAASCTTTGLAHMLKPLLENETTSRILTASMSTIHSLQTLNLFWIVYPKRMLQTYEKQEAF